VKDEERESKPLWKMLRDNIGQRNIGVVEGRGTGFWETTIQVCVGSGKWRVTIAPQTTMRGLAKAFGLKKARWWRTEPTGVYTESRGVGC
jgi:hypothetical protein